jgi:hypothetical protein
VLAVVGAALEAVKILLVIFFAAYLEEFREVLPRRAPLAPLPVYALPGALDAVLALDRPGVHEADVCAGSRSVSVANGETDSCSASSADR